MTQITHISCNQSSRNGAKIMLLTAHTTEGPNAVGIRDLVGLGNYFDQPSTQASSHKAGDIEGNRARFVPDSRKAWTQAAYNPICLSWELIAYASWGPEEWKKAEPGLKAMARDFAIWCHRHDIPPRWSTTHGICEHRELGAAGGGHHDCGPHFPREHFMALVQKYYASPAVEAEAKKKQRWAERRDHERARLKSILSTRRRLRQRKLEKTARYEMSTKELDAVRTRIEKLTKLIGRK